MAQAESKISALLSTPNQPFRISALTRNKTSAKAQSLAQQSSNVSIVEGDFNNVDHISRQVGKPLWGIFIVTNPSKGSALEEKQGKDIVNAAVDAGLEHIVFTSTDRGGQERSDNDPTIVPHFASKYNIERLIIEKSQRQRKDEQQQHGRRELTYTFLRPVAFFENLTPDFLGKAFVSMWRLNGNDNKLQLVNTTDVGKIAAQAFLHASEPEYRDKAISLAGDELTPWELERILKEETTKDVPATFGFVGRVLRYMLNDMGIMLAWFKNTGFGVHIGGLRQRYPFLTDFRTWLKTESAWKDK